MSDEDLKKQKEELTKLRIEYLDDVINRIDKNLAPLYFETKYTMNEKKKFEKLQEARNILFEIKESEIYPKNIRIIKKGNL